MNAPVRHINSRQPWTGVPANALGTPWTLRIERNPRTHAPVRIAIHSDCGAIVAETAADKAAIRAHELIVDVVNHCAMAREQATGGTGFSWDCLTVGEIERSFALAQRLNTALIHLMNRHNQSSPEASAVMRGWWQSILPAQRQALRDLASMQADTTVRDLAASGLSQAIYLPEGQRFGLRITGDFELFVATGNIPGRRLVMPRHLTSHTPASLYRKAKTGLKPIRTDASPEMADSYAAWGGVIVPSVNAFCSVIERRQGVPDQFPATMKILLNVPQDLAELTQGLTHAAPDVGAELTAIAEDTDRMKAVMTQKIDGNAELLKLSPAQRSKVYQGFGVAIARDKSGRAYHVTQPKKPARDKQGAQLGLEFIL